MEICPVGAALIQTDMIKLTGSFRDCVNALKNKLHGAESFLWSLYAQRFNETRRFLRARYWIIS